MALSVSQWKNTDRRDSPRTRLHLRLAVVYPRREGLPVAPIYHGTSHDVSASGLSMLAEDNVFQEGEVTVLLTLPPVHNWAAPEIITVASEMTYAIHSSKLNGFKIGMTFLEFSADGKQKLEAALRGASNQGAADGSEKSGARSPANFPGSNRPPGG